MPRARQRERDVFGSKVPWWLHDVFRTRRLMLQCSGRLGEVKKQIAALTDELGGDRLDLVQVHAALELARALIAEGAPYRQCDCGPEEECNKCHGTRWLTAAEYRPGSGPRLL